MATFRTDPNTGRTVISESNRVDRPSDPGDLYSDRNRARSRPDFLSRDEFETATGMTATNPYGKQGFFSRVFGIDPNKISYANNLGPQGIENVKIQAYDRYVNPFAKFDAFDRPTMGADASLGLTRSGFQPGDMSIFGPGVQSQREGIAGLFEQTLLGSVMPKQTRIPGYDRNVLLPELMAGSAVGGGTEPPGIPYFTSSTNPPLALDAPSMEEIKSAREAAEPSFGETDFQTERRATEEDSPVFRGNVPESTYRPLFTDDVTVADIIAAAPMSTESVGGSVLVNPRPTVTTPETANERLMRERQEAFDANLRRRAEETQRFGESMRTFAEEEAARRDRIDALLGGSSSTTPQPAPAFPQVDLTSLISPEFPVPSPVTPPRGIDPRALSLAQELQRGAQGRAMQ